MLGVGLEINRDHLLRELIRIQYTRSDIDFHRGTFRVQGDTSIRHLARRVVI